VRGSAAYAGCLLLLGVVVAASACVSTPEARLGERVGCYYFERDAGTEALQLPWGIHLQADSLVGWPAWAAVAEVRRAVTLVGPGETETFPFGYWRPLRHDSLEIGYPGGGGLQLQLEVESGRLTGTARSLGGALRPPAQLSSPASHPVTLLHARCPDA
jgi:hypothetical protein